MAPQENFTGHEINTGTLNISNHYFGGRLRWSEPPHDEPISMEEAQARIDQLYEAGYPFFSKERIRFVHEQCQRKPRCGEMIYVKDITGALVEVECQTGDVKGKEIDKDVAETFQTYLQDWRETEVAKKLIQSLTAHAATHSISKIVGLALGAMSYQYDSRPRCYIQHALLLTLRKWLVEREKTEDVVCHAQDPGYRSVDREILHEHGIEVINDPQAWLEIDDKSLVFSVSPNVPVKEIVADIARPAIVIWERVGFMDGDQKGKITDPDSPRVRAMMEQYELFDFGAEDDDNFSHTFYHLHDPPPTEKANMTKAEDTRPPLSGVFTSLGHAPFVQPSSYLRPPMASQPERPIDVEERQGLRAIRNFLKVRTSYDVLPLSFRLIIFDTGLSVKESLNILIQNGMQIDLKRHIRAKETPADRIVSAPLWDSKASKFAGLLTTSDYINVIQYYFQNPAALDQIDQFRLDSLREVEKALGVAPPETISIDPERPLYEACRRMLESRARRIPLVTNDSQTDRSHVLSVITQYRILKFVAVNVGDTQKLRRPLGELLLGTYENIATASMDTPVIDVIHILVERSISSVPILNSEGVVYNVFEAVDVIALTRGGTYDDLGLSVGEVLKKRSPEFPGIYTCSLNDGLDTIFDTIRKSRVHRLVVVDEHFKLKGVLTLSDILHYILLEGENDEV
ncbi:5'-AMP-activated protein kinase subunit gamma [Penicillium rolfsii]|nr:5'-AMP-activated protein kinase subunit gamma [Penicillium rolfsii]